MHGYEFWDHEITAPTHNSWMEPEQTRHYINTSISGDPGKWPLDWFQETFPNRQFARALSIGCGTGALERDLVRRNVALRVDAFDGSIGSLVAAREAALSEGMHHRIHYFAADFNEPSLPHATYDFVVFHQSLHHVGKLEKLLRELLRVMTADGLLYFDEFVGPSRTDWNDQTLAKYRALYRALPREVRFFDVLPLPIQWDDPSEAVRSSEILPQLRLGFRLLHVRGYGGNVLAMMYPGLVPTRITPPLIAEMTREETRLLSEGDTPFHAVVVAMPKVSRLARTLAGMRYFVEPKIKRVLRELRARLRFS